MIRYRHARLVGIDNREYLADAAAHARAYRLARLRESGAASAAMRIAIEFERVVRAALERAAGLHDDRVLSYEEACRGRGYVRRYRELDAVSVAAGGMTVFEIKASRAEKSALGGMAQLRKAGAILGRGSLVGARSLALALVWVDTGGRATEASWSTVTSPEGLSAALQREDAMSEPASRVRVTARDAWSWRGELGIEADDALWEEYEAERVRDERRRALADAGIDVKDDGVDVVAVERTGTGYRAGTAGSPESAMALAVRAALRRQGKQ